MLSGAMFFSRRLLDERKSFFGILAVALLACGCGDSGAHPSYSGKYRLNSISHVGFRAADFPFELSLPQDIEVYQYPLKRFNGVNFHRVALRVAEGVLFDQSQAEERLNASGYLELLSRPYSFEDAESKWLGWGKGYACKFTLSAQVEFSFSPTTETLDSVYPVCEEEIINGQALCTSKRKWTDMETLSSKWDEAGLVTLTVKFSASKKLETGFQEDCTQTSQESVMSALYEKVEDYDLGDPREELSPEAKLKLEKATIGQPNILRRVFPMPADGSGLIDVFQSGI